jgi:hypothetical protein
MNLSSSLLHLDGRIATDANVCTSLASAQPVPVAWWELTTVVTRQEWLMTRRMLRQGMLSGWVELAPPWGVLPQHFTPRQLQNLRTQHDTI